eukprot:UN1165
MDETSIGEDMKDVSKQIQETYMEMLTDKTRHFLDQKSQTDHLARLVDMLGEHLNSTKPADERVFESIKDMEERMEKLGEDCRTMKQSVAILMNPEGTTMAAKKRSSMSSIEAMRNDIVGLRRLLIKDSATHKMKLEAVVKNVAEVKERASRGGTPEALNQISDQTDSLAKTVVSRGRQMSWMMVCLLAAIFGIGALMWNRMLYYEKKHFI